MINKLKKSMAGFTLVELIVVIAIIGVLAAVLAPQYIKYVDKSREAVDANIVDEIAHAAEVAIAQDDVYQEVKAAGGATITVSQTSITVTPTTDGKSTAKLLAAIELVVPSDKVTFKSVKYTAEGAKATIGISTSGLGTIAKP